MSMVSVFFIILVAVFATLAYFTEPSDTEKRIQERLSGLDRPVTQGEDDQTEIVKRVTFSKIIWLDRFLREYQPALTLQMFLEQGRGGLDGRTFFLLFSLLHVSRRAHWKLVGAGGFCRLDSRVWCSGWPPLDGSPIREPSGSVDSICYFLTLLT